VNTAASRTRDVPDGEAGSCPIFHGSPPDTLFGPGAPLAELLSIMRTLQRHLAAPILLSVISLLLYGRPSALEGGLLLPYTTHVSGDRTVALTFDDGPDPVFTPQVLDVLARHDVKATFFVLGRRADDHPELVRQIVAAGHAVGSHGYSHAILRGVWPGEIATELRQTDAALWRAAGIRTRLFRHPGGLQGAFLPSVAQAGGWRVVV